MGIGRANQMIERAKNRNEEYGIKAMKLVMRVARLDDSSAWLPRDIPIAIRAARRLCARIEKDYGLPS